MMTFTAHSHNLRAEVHTRGSLYFVFSYEWNNTSLVSTEAPALAAGAEPRKVYRILVNRSGKKIRAPRIYLRRIFQSH